MVGTVRVLARPPRIAAAPAGRALALAGIVTSLALALAQSASADDSSAATKAARGYVATGFERARGGLCGQAYESRVADGKIACTHGADPAPVGEDVRRRRSTSELAAKETEAAAETGVVASASGTSVPCIGNGTDGNRVLAVYAYPAGAPDRYAQVAPLIRGWAAGVDAVVNASAAETGGIRHVRFVTRPDCELVVEKVALSPAGDDTFENTLRELDALGYSRSDRKYLVWMDANVYCGVASFFYDDRPVADNYNNGNAAASGTVARVDNGCWAYAEAHELVHMLGGVQASAPNATPYGHCSDEADVMCYVDGPGVAMRQVCAGERERLLDCKHDDYFHTSPAAGTYLASHWNTASSSFLTSDGAPATRQPDPTGGDRRDTTAPLVTAPRHSFRLKPARRIRVALRWSAIDADSGVVRVSLWQSTDGRPYSRVALATRTATRTVRRLAPGHRYRFRVEAVDAAGNTGAAEGSTFRVTTGARKK